MSVHMIYYKDGVKMMRPILNREDYLALRDSKEQQSVVAAVRNGNEALKHRLVQMNYSCLPNEDGSLKGSTRLSSTIGMDVDHIAEEDMEKVKEGILAHQEELGLQMLELSARGAGYHLVFRRKKELGQEENLRWASGLLGVEYDKGAKDVTRVFFTTTGSKEDLLFLSDEIFAIEEVVETLNTNAKEETNVKKETNVQKETNVPKEAQVCSPDARIRFLVEGVMKEKGLVATDFLSEGGRHTSVKIFLSGVAQLLTKAEVNGVLQELMPQHWNDGNIQTLVDDFYRNYAHPSQRLLKYQEQLFTQSQRMSDTSDETDEEDDAEEDDQLSMLNGQISLRRLPMGVRDSVAAVGPEMAMPVLIAICPAIGMLATGVRLDVHGTKNALNLISYVAGDFASGKGGIDPVIAAWMAELRMVEKVYEQQEEDWRAKKRAAKNKKEQPEEPKLPVRCLTLNNTVANLAERLSNTEGKHAFSFTPEADTVAQKWKSTMSDFSVMLRQSYDGSRYDREARSAEAVNVHIEHLLWNVTMCGTPDALYRVVNNYTDGFQSRIAVARTPDNTFSPLEEKPHVLTPSQAEHIWQIAHLLPLMQGEVVLPKLEEKGREWVERIRLETMKNDDKVRARQRFRTCVTAQRMTCCIMLCKVAEGLIQKHGANGAETLLKQQPDLWKEWLQKAQTPKLLKMYDVVADYLLETALFFFRDRIEHAFTNSNYVGNNERQRPGRNDTIFARLDVLFTMEQALQQSAAVKSGGVTHNSVRQMLKNWKKQGLIVSMGNSSYRKVQEVCH